MEDTDFIKLLRANAKSCRNMYELCLKLGIESIGGNTYREIKKIAQENNITLIFNHKAKIVTGKKENIQISDLLIDGSNIKSNALKEKLIECGYKERKCECCGRSEWNGKSIPLELHHINGKHDDNRIDNIQILCRNCHGQTDNFCGRNTKKKRKLVNKTHKTEYDNHINIDYLKRLLITNTLKNVAEELDVSIYRLKTWIKKYNLVLSQNEIEEYIKENDTKIGKCKHCGKPFIKNNHDQIFCSKACAHAGTMVVNITKDELVSSLKEFGSFLKTGEKYGVSDKCVTKWCIRFGIPSKKKELTEYLNSI